MGSYFSLIKSIAKGCHKLQNIAIDLNVKQTNLTKYLNVLINLDLIKNSYELNYMPYIYEEVARIFSFKYAIDKKLYINKIGRYWDNKTVEIDIVGLNEDRNIALFGECKYSNKYYVLFSISGFSDDLISLSKYRNDLFLIEGIEEYR